MHIEIKLPSWIEENRTYIEPVFFILLSFASFFCLQYAVRWYLFGKCRFRTFNYFKFALKRRKRSRPVPPSQSLQLVPPNKKWRISNEFVSLIHSVLSGLWALYALLMIPKLASEMNTYVDKNPLGLVYLTFGYLIHDLIDLLWNERSYRILELLFHHVIVLIALLTTIVTHLFLGVLVFGLLMEINSIFLHTRSLMNLYGQPKTSTAFKFVALLNVLSFILFRMCVSIYLLYWQITNALSMPWYLTIITFVVIVSSSTTNTVLLYRVLAADGLLGNRRSRQSTSLTTASDGENGMAGGGNGGRRSIHHQQNRNTSAFIEGESSADRTGSSCSRRNVDEAADEFGSSSGSSTDFDDYEDEEEHDDIEACTIPPGSTRHNNRRQKKNHHRQKRSSKKHFRRRASTTTGTQTADPGAEMLPAATIITPNGVANTSAAYNSQTSGQLSPIVVTVPPKSNAIVILDDEGKVKGIKNEKIEPSK